MEKLPEVHGLELPDVDRGHRPGLVSIIESMPVSKLINLHVVGTADGCSVLTMQPETSATFDGRHLMGGITATFADMGAVSAAVAAHPEGSQGSTTNFTVHLTAPARGSLFVAVGRVIAVAKARTSARADVFAVEDGRATHVATCLAEAKIS